MRGKKRSVMSLLETQANHKLPATITRGQHEIGHISRARQIPTSLFIKEKMSDIKNHIISNIVKSRKRKESCSESRPYRFSTSLVVILLQHSPTKVSQIETSAKYFWSKRGPRMKLFRQSRSVPPKMGIKELKKVLRGW